MIAVITADLEGSSLYEDEVLTKVLSVLKNEFKTLNGMYSPTKLKFKIYRGDSFQGVVKAPELALRIALQIKTAVNLVHLKDTQKNKTYSRIADLKIAIGIGSIDIERTNIEESNGQAFHFSGRTLDEMKREGRKTRLQTPNEAVNAEFNASLFLLDLLTDRWSIASAEVVYYLLQGKKEREISEEIGISQSAVNQRKKVAGWEAISVLLERYFQVANKHFKNG